MQIEYSPYELKSQNGARKGALLKVHFEPDLIGYADCHPWECMGHAKLDDQLKALSKKKTTPLLDRSLQLALIDAKACQNGTDIWKGLHIPSSNYLITNLKLLDLEKVKDQVSLGFDRFKVKLGRDLPNEVLLLKQLSSSLPPNCKLRLDFGSLLTQSVFEDFLKEAEPYRDQLDYCEDPFPFDPKAWQEIERAYKIRLACDYESELGLKHPKSASVLIIKPAVQNIDLFLNTPAHELVVTSYLDHPVGTLGAAYMAAIAYQKHPKSIMTCGLLTHHVYEPNMFSEKMMNKGPALIPPKGPGWGYGEELAKLEWKKV